MPTDVLMPQMGESIAEGTLVRWIKKVGDTVDRDEPLFEISTDKVDAEIPSPAAGTLSEIRVKEGETVAVNSVVAVIAVAGEKIAAPAPQQERKAAGAGVQSAAAERDEWSVDEEEEEEEEGEEEGEEEDEDEDEDDKAAAAAPAETPEDVRRQKSSPLVRKIAREHNVDITAVPGTGLSGRVTKDDILGFIEQAAASAGAKAGAPPSPSPAATAAPAGLKAGGSTIVDQGSTIVDQGSAIAAGAAIVGGGADLPPSLEASADRRPPTHDASADRRSLGEGGSLGGGGQAAAPEEAGTTSLKGGPPSPAAVTFRPGERVRVEPMSVMRRKIAEHMVLSARTSPHVYSVYEVNFARVAKLRDAKRDAYEAQGVKLTFTGFIAKAAVDALRAFPIVNASIDGDKIVYKADINLGVAVALDGGLIVPVIKNADEKNLLGISRAIQDLAARARTKKLQPEDVQGGTFTITNPGIFGALYGLPMINQPQVAILGVGAIEKRAVVVNDAIAVRPTAHLSLGYDHRLIDGADAGRFLQYLKQRLEEFDEAWC